MTQCHRPPLKRSNPISLVLLALACRCIAKWLTTTLIRILTTMATAMIRLTVTFCLSQSFRSRLMKHLMPKTVCLGCGIPTVNPSRCDGCAVAPKSYYATKLSSTARGYDSKWRKVRLKVLNRDQWTCYLCQKHLVGRDATVDHLVPISVAPHLRLEETNLRACCLSCNSGKRDR